MRSFFSPAKINFFFRVLYKRKDGFHEIASLMQALSFGDSLHVSVSPEDRLTYEGWKIPTDCSNLILQALDLFRRETGWRQKIHIHVEKRVPPGSGLGGGSSNAATMLWALKEISKLPLNSSTLFHLAAQIGSDVPFFLSSGCSYCEGRGEKIKEQKIIFTKPLYLALVDESISTEQVYRVCIPNSQSTLDPTNILRRFIQGQMHGVNDLESAAFSICPKLASIKMSLEGIFEACTMTGSGSSFYCIGKPKRNIAGINLVPVTLVGRKENHWY